ncbi:hypothetical protein [Desulfopila aestuarii]|uniref:Flavodoxin n=1 Tax=Desulfopila aestuarii DSM 18488 TaxID=1121416 RepID=A0A1M7YAT0_9BACT|nr:hypothetical protein [Desulfopila aestuarii]SHO49701.1 hypothetical protein SAMN02745220_03025 [Desulfopila aestuarii DSM 18488]
MCKIANDQLINDRPANTKRVLIVYYSFSGQTQLLLQRMGAAMRECGVEVEIERLQLVEPIQFPFATWLQMSRVMVYSFFRWRVPIQPVDHLLNQEWDLVILAGPTWSYNPSGPMLYFLDQYGAQLVNGTRVMPLISCRSYWRTHYWGISRILKKLGAEVMEPIIYLHSANEPWRTIGLFLQLVGRLPRLETSWFRKRYPRYGHSREQWQDAAEQGRKIARMLLEE